MHLLAATQGTIGDGEEAVDLAQEPADILILSAADSELAALAAAYHARAGDLPSLRLASLLLLRHPMSVDLWLDRTARHAKLIIARVLGGRGYWQHGVDQLAALAAAHGIRLALLPGGDAPLDEELLERANLPRDVCEALRALLAAGGTGNAELLLDYAARLLEDDTATPPAPRPLPAAGPWRDMPPDDKPVAAIIFYRALIEGGFTAPVAALCDALERQGLAPAPIFVTSLKDPAARAVLADLFAERPPEVIVNLTAFAAGDDDPLSAADCPVLQALPVGAPAESWRDNPQGLTPRDLAMLVALPELDGRITTRPMSFKEGARFDDGLQCPIATYSPHAPGIAHIAELAARWAALRRKPDREKRIAIVLANYPNRDSRIGNGVGYDTPASTIAILLAMKEAGYAVKDIPENGDALIRRLQAGPINASGAVTPSVARLALADYRRHYNALHADVRAQIEHRWGKPEDDPFFRAGAFHLPIALHGNVLTAIQPARGYNIDPEATYHDPALPPPHGYLAFYIWLRAVFGADAVIHNGKHGNLEWLPGKALALSDACFPTAVFGPLPQLYPFIVNDPGEGAQAKRRTSAVIIDHLTPPMARAGTYGTLAALERLMDEYYQAMGMDARRATALRRDILDLAHTSGVAADAGAADAAEDDALTRLDAWLCEIKEAQIRNGLHVLGRVPEGEELAEFIAALARLPAEDTMGLTQALAADLLEGFDPLEAGLAAPWNGPKPDVLAAVSDAPWRTTGDTVERLERLALDLIRAVIAGDMPDAPARTQDVLRRVRDDLLPRVMACGRDEMAHLLVGLQGRFVPPGPAGAPTRGRLDVLPTGRNFFSLDPRALPTPAAWRLGRKSADTMLKRHFQEHGEYPAAIGLSCWGTANMRTGGDDIAQALALIGVKPVWDHASGRVTGYEIMPLAELGRPRIDVTLRISGFFRDAFPAQIELFDKAIRAVGALEEPEADNPIAARMRREAAELRASGLSQEDAARLAGFRIFGAKPGAYGAGLQAMIDESLWQTEADLAESYINWGAYAYGAKEQGERAEEGFRRRLGQLDAIAHNQDNREHDVLDSDDYYQFEGGMAAAAAHVQGKKPGALPVWHNDHSRPERPVTRSLEEEIGRVTRARVANPKWIAAMMRHGYKGAFEMAATVDYMFAFAATTRAVKNHHFGLAFDAFIRDEQVRAWIREHNPAALDDMLARFEEALARRLWRPAANDVVRVIDEARRSA